MTLALVVGLSTVENTTSAPPVQDAQFSTAHVANGSFTLGRIGWRPANSATSLRLHVDTNGNRSAVLVPLRTASLAVTNSPNTWLVNAPGDVFRVSALLRTQARRLHGQMAVAGRDPAERSVSSFRLHRSNRWTVVQALVETKTDNTTLDITLTTSRTGNASALQVDDVKINLVRRGDKPVSAPQVAPTPTPTPTPPPGPDPDPTPTPTPTPTLPSVTAQPAQKLVDTFGVDIHLGYTGTPYTDITSLTDAVQKLGVKHLRTRLVINNPTMYSNMKTLAATGALFDVTMGTPTSTATPADLVQTIASYLPSGVVESVEGANEWDLTGRTNWAAEVRAHQQALYAAVNAHDVTKNLPVLSPSLGKRDTYDDLGDLSTVSDFGNVHLYPAAQKPSDSISTMRSAQALVTGSKPVIFTETGYHNAMNTTLASRYPTPESVVGVYAPRLLLEHYIQGTEREYNYEIVDQYADPGKVDPEKNFGLMRHDWTPKPSYHALRNLLTLAADPGAAFTPGALAYRVSAAPADMRQTLLQKQDGTFLLLLWRDVSIYDRMTETPLEVTPVEVQVELGSSYNVKVHRPSTSASAVTSLTGSTVPLSLDGQITALTLSR